MVEVRWCRGVSWPFVGMVVVVLADVSSMMVSKAAMSRGMSNFILVVYSKALSSIILLFPSSFFFIFHRPELPPLTTSILGRLFLLALNGCLGQISGYAGIKYSSPLLGTAMLNLVPAFTFMLAIVFRMERLDWRSSSTQAKSIGTLVSIAGAFVVTFFKGPPILLTTPPPPSISTHHKLHLSPQPNWVLGAFLCSVEALTNSIWFIMQASILKEYPSELITVFYYCVFVTIQSAVVSLIVERDPSTWMLRPDVGLVAVFYTAVIGIVLRMSVCSWCLKRTGPLYTAMFKPLAIVAAFIFGVLFAGDCLYLGSLVGAFIIITGFYAVMWGKAKEEKASKDGEVGSLEPPCLEEAPLLQQNKIYS